MAENVPDASMMAAVERLARFMTTRSDADLIGVFAEADVTIIENFAPYVFEGPDAVQKWASGFRQHALGLAELQQTFGPPQDFSMDEDLAYLSLPTNWTGTSNGRRFSEDGGWAFVLVRHGNEWRVQNYGWAVTEYRLI